MDKELRTELAIHRQAERRIHAKLADEIERCTKYVLHKTGYVGDDGKPLLAALYLFAAGGLLGLVRLGDFGQHQIRPFGIDGNRFKPRAQPGLQFFFA